jgi:hypothetical protein
MALALLLSLSPLGLLSPQVAKVQLHSLFVDRFGKRGWLDRKRVEFSVNLRPRLLRLLHSLR